jgi:hypothetical protein
MTDETRPFDELLSKVTQEFYVRGGRLYAHEAEAGKLDRQTIELKCEAGGSLFHGSSIVIGDDEHPRANPFDDDDDDETDEARANQPVETERGWRLETLHTMVSIYPVDEAWIAESAGRHDGKPIRGLLSYHPAIVTSDGAANEKRPMVSAWVAVGPDTFRLLRDELLSFKDFAFSLSLDLRFERASVTPNWIGRQVAWDGEGSIPVDGMTVLWKREDWSPDFRRRKARSNTKPDLTPEPSREHSDAMGAAARIEAAVSKLTTPLWLILGALAALLFFHR